MVLRHLLCTTAATLKGTHAPQSICSHTIRRLQRIVTRAGSSEHLATENIEEAMSICDGQLVLQPGTPAGAVPRLNVSSSLSRMGTRGFYPALHSLGPQVCPNPCVNGQYYRRLRIALLRMFDTVVHAVAARRRVQALQSSTLWLDVLCDGTLPDDSVPLHSDDVTMSLWHGSIIPQLHRPILAAAA